MFFFIIELITSVQFYPQKELSLLVKEFTVIKIQLMRIAVEKNDTQWRDKNDNQIIKLGLFSRKTQINKLSRLINLLKQELNIIGRRAERKDFVDELSKVLLIFPKRIEDRPGLPGGIQVKSKYEISPEEKQKFDLYYIKHNFVLMDIVIF